MNQKELFEKAYMDFADSIFRYLHLRIYDRDTAIELTQETFFKTWDYISKGKNIDNIKAFLYRTAHNLYVNNIRDKKKFISLDEIHEKIGFDIVDLKHQESREKEMNLNQVLESLNKLNTDDAELIKIRYFDGLSLEEISEIKGKSINSLTVKIHRILEKLKKYNN